MHLQFNSTKLHTTKCIEVQPTVKLQLHLRGDKLVLSSPDGHISRTFHLLILICVSGFLSHDEDWLDETTHSQRPRVHPLGLGAQFWRLLAPWNPFCAELLYLLPITTIDIINLKYHFTIRIDIALSWGGFQNLKTQASWYTYCAGISLRAVGLRMLSWQKREWYWVTLNTHTLSLSPNACQQTTFLNKVAKPREEHDKSSVF